MQTVLAPQGVASYPSSVSSVVRLRAESTKYSPMQNQILAALPVEDRARILSSMEVSKLTLGSTLHNAGTREKFLYFIVEGLVSEFFVMENGAAAELISTGNEGVIGLSAFLGGERTPTQAVVLSAGYAFRLSATRLQSEIEQRGALLQLLLRYTHATIVQSGQIAVCNRHHMLDQRLCRWLLSSFDRVNSNELFITQAQLAELLGVRREGIAEAAGRLQKAGLIQCRRRHIVVCNRPKLEEHACECYAGVKRERDRVGQLADRNGGLGRHVFDASRNGPVFIDRINGLSVA